MRYHCNTAARDLRWAPFVVYSLTFLCLLLAAQEAKAQSLQTLPGCGGTTFQADFSKVETTITGGWYLTFPLCDHSDTDTIINTVMDHYSPSRWYDKDKTTVPFSGEAASKIWGYSTKTTPYDCTDLYQNSSATPFSLGGRYSGVSSCADKGLASSYFLSYDGHPGFDFNVASGGELRATADGDLIVPATDLVNCPRGSCGPNNVSPGQCFNTFYIDHHNGYTSWYLHALDHNTPGPVKRGQLIGHSGKTDCISAIGAHLHYELRLGTDTPIDPFGWQGGPTTLQDTQTLGVGDPYIYSDPSAPKSTQINWAHLGAYLWTSSGTRWDFTLIGNSLGWTPINVENFSIQNGAINLDPAAKDPQLIGPPLNNVNAADFQSIEVSIASGGPNGLASIYFTTEADPVFSDSKHVDCQLTTDGSFHVYRFPMKTNSYWQGTISRLRLDPAGTGVMGSSSDTVAIQHIYLSPSPATSNCSSPSTEGSPLIPFLTPSNQSVPAGGAAAFNVNVQSGDLSSHAITVSVSGLPPSSSSSIDPPLSVTGVTSSLTVRTQTSTPPGTYHVQVSASTGGTAATTGADLQVLPSVSSPCGGFSGVKQPIWLAEDGVTLFVGSQGQFSAIKEASGSISSATFGPYPGSYSGRPVISGGVVYVPLWNLGDVGQVAMVDENSYAIKGYIQVQGQPWATAANNGKIYVAHNLVFNDGSPSTVEVIDSGTAKVVAQIPVGIGAVYITIDPATARGYVANSSSMSISIIDLSQNVVVQTVPLDIAPNALMIFNSQLLVVGNVFQAQSGMLLELDPVTGRELRRLAIGRDPADIATFGGVVLVSDQSDYNVVVIDPGTLSIVKTVATGSAPTGLVVDQSTQTGFVANQGDMSMSLLCRSAITPVPAALILDPSTIQAGALASATMALSGPADPDSVATLQASGGGVAPPNTVSAIGLYPKRLASSASNLTLDQSLTAGVGSAVFALRTQPSATNQVVDISGTYNGTSVSGSLTITPGAVASVEPGSLQFAPQLINSNSAVQTITVGNHGAPLTVTSVSLGGDFAAINHCASPVPDGASCTIDVTYSPKTVGVATISGLLIDTSYDSPQQLIASGVGADLQLGPAVGSSLTQTVIAGASASYDLSLIPVGGFNDSVALSCSGAPSTTICSVSPGSISLDGINPASVSVKVTTVTRSAHLEVPRILLLAFASLGLPLIWKKRTHFLSLGVVAIFLVLTLSCGGGTASPPSPSGTTAGTYTLNLTASASRGGSRTTALTLVVK